MRSVNPGAWTAVKKMPDFESGVASYIHGQASIDVYFPVDKRGNEDGSCYQCYYYRRNYQTCGLNVEICQYPSKYLGSLCPLKFIDNMKETNNEII